MPSGDADPGSDAGLEMTIAADLAAIADVRRWLVGHARARGCGRSLLSDLRLALTEALTNVVRHAYPDAGGPIRVALEFCDDAIVVRVTDWGVPFQGDERVHPDLSEPQVGGYGMLLIQRRAERVRYTRGGTGGNVLEMVFSSTASRLRATEGHENPVTATFRQNSE